jgi:2-methylcitrate dehydratase PrpD
MTLMDAGPRLESPEGREIHVLGSYIAGALDNPLPPEVAEKAKHHVLDTLAAMITGARLHVGEMAISYAATLGGTAEACIVGSPIVTTAVNAALANGMLAHADETDDSHAPSISHPGCVIVPAALAMAERHDRSGEAFVKAVVLGYDILTRLNMSLGAAHIYQRGHGPYSIGGAWGAAAAAAALAGIPASRMPFLISNVAQQTSGIATWMRDEEHIEKAFHFGGLPARNGVAAASMVKHGFTGVDDVLTGRGNFMDAFSDQPDPGLLVRGLGTEFEIMRTNIKKWSVGSPIQSALDSLEYLMVENGVTADAVEEIVVQIPAPVVYVVDDRSMPDINLQHCLALMLIDGKFTFAASHEYARMADPAIVAMKKRIKLTGSDELATAKPVRQAIVDVALKSGERLSRRTYSVKGTPESPMDRSDVIRKASDLLEPVLGKPGSDDLIQRVYAIEGVRSMRDLRPILQYGAT